MTKSHHGTPSGWADLSADAQIQLSIAISDRINELVGDSVPWNKRLTPVQNGREYLRRYRCIDWAYELVEAAEAMGIGTTEPELGCPDQWKATIATAEAFLEFQRGQWFATVAATFGAEAAAEDEAKLQRMQDGPIEEFRHSLEKSLGDGPSPGR